MPFDTFVKSGAANGEDGLFTGLVSRIPERTRALFDEEHWEALRSACRKMKWGEHPVNIRLSLPTFFSRYYLVVLAGPERRGKERRVQEKSRFPLHRLTNYLFIAAMALLGIYAVVFVESLLFLAFTRQFTG